jgi:hypothetical protein
VERVEAHHERLGRPLLRDGGDRVLPQRDDPLLREVVAELVQHGVELDVRALVEARAVGVERRAPGGAEAVGREELPGDAGAEHVARVVDARLVERRARDGAAGAAGDERGGRRRRG